MRRAVLLPAVLCVLAAATSSRARAEEVVVAWRSPFGLMRSVSANATDSSCWVADGGAVLHVAADGTILSQSEGFYEPTSVSVNPSDGSCWVFNNHPEWEAERGEIVHLAEDGTELWRGSVFSAAYAHSCLAANASDGSCWAAGGSGGDYVAHLAEDGTELWRGSGFGQVRSLSVNPTDGSCWVADVSGCQLVHLAGDGTELWRTGAYQPWSVSVNPTDGSCWLFDTTSGRVVVHVAEDGTELWRGGAGLFGWQASVSVNPADGSCWVADHWAHDAEGQCVVHLAEDGTELWRGWGFRVPSWPNSYPNMVSVDPADGSCWVADLSRLVHLAADGSELWQGKGLGLPTSVCVNPTDGSCWASSIENPRSDDPGGYGGQVMHLAQDGTELCRVDGFDGPASVSVNQTDGSCWVCANTEEVVHLAEDGSELRRVGGFYGPVSVSVNPRDGSFWVADLGNCEVVHLAAEGTKLARVGGFTWPHAVSVYPSDGSCWASDDEPGSVVAHLAENGSVLWWREAYGRAESVSVNTTDGSVWLATDQVTHLSADGNVLWQSPLSATPMSLSVNAADGSCWLAHQYGQVVHLAADGTELWRGAGHTGWSECCSVSVNPADGSCWVAYRTYGQVVHLVIPGWRPPVFCDVPPHFWAFEQVEACYEAGIVAGYGDGLYHPSNPVDRGQMAVYISRALAGGEEYVPEFTGTPSFPDVGDTHWALDYVEYAAAQNVVAGYDDGSYHPEYQVTRDQMAVYVARALVAPEGEAGLADYVPADPRSFPDVPSDHWAYRHIEYCVENGVVSGYLDGNYHPEGVVTRDQMAVYVARAFGLPT